MDVGKEGNIQLPPDLKVGGTHQDCIGYLWLGEACPGSGMSPPTAGPGVLHLQWGVGAPETRVNQAERVSSPHFTDSTVEGY